MLNVKQVELETKATCVFCKLISEKDPSVEFLDEEFVCIKNIRPLDEIHLLICTKAHMETYFDDTTASNNFSSAIENPMSAGSYTSLVKTQLREKLLNLANKIITDRKLKSAAVVINFKPPYATVPHAHLHIIGFNTVCKNKTGFV